jgi:GT2 family glycosyltransferase
MTPESSQNIVVVVIGRNEGERLRSCLRSVFQCATRVVYVDSGSHDGSPDYAASMGCRVVALDSAQPFSAARARNEGFAAAVERWPNAALIQFLDGDCDLMQGWLEQGAAALKERSDVGIVCGNVREQHPEMSVYNRLCNLEWQQVPGEILTSGGRFLIRAETFQAVGGFRADVIAAEDDEFCIRVRGLGWKILQLDGEMALHDAAMTHFSEWWRRSRRAGYAYAQVAALHGKSGERYFVYDCRKIWFWALWLPLAALCLAPFTRGLSLAVLLIAYALQFVRIYKYGRGRGWQLGDALVYSLFTVIFKFPALLGLLEYHWRQGRGDDPKIIEYKGSTPRR